MSETVIVEIEMASSSEEAIRRLADVLRGDSDDPLALMLQDALRTYCWIVREQARGRDILTLSTADRKALTDGKNFHEISAKLIPSYIPDGFTSRVLTILGEEQAAASTAQRPDGEG